jgi:predicted porin
LNGKWSLLAATALLAGVSTDATAQSSVTIFGLMDVGVTYITNESGKSVLQAKDGQNSPNLWGITGKEDLGGGLRAIFLLRDQFVVGTGSILPGQQLWSKTAYVGLDGDRFGTLTLGEQYDFMRNVIDDAPSEISGHLYSYPGGPFQKLGIPSNPTGFFDWSRLTGTPVSNSVLYMTPSLYGFKAGAMYGFGNVAGSIGTGNTSSFSLDYARGAFGADAAYTSEKYIQTAGPQITVRTSGVGARYSWGDFLVEGLTTNVRNVTLGGAAASYTVGGRYRFTPVWSLGLSYMYLKGNAVLTNNHASQVSGIIDFALSRRTSVYAIAAYQRANEGARAQINGLTESTASASGPNQAVFRLGLHTRF